MNIFIDANIYLDFFFYSKDDLEELRKLEVLLREQRATLWLPRQVEDEVVRMRETQIAAALKALRDQTLNLKFPQICQGHAELAELRELQRQYALLHERLIAAILESAQQNTLKADEILVSLFHHCKRIDLSASILEAARSRMDRGNPPGKNKKLGDAINWECLLQAVPMEELHLISGDQDFASIIDRDRPNPFLEREWKDLKIASLRYYSQLAPFLRQYFPQVKLAEDLEKAILVERLAASTTFAETHLLIARLTPWSRKFNLSELTLLLKAAASNRQIYWIMTDPDVYAFISCVMFDAQGKVPDELIATVRGYFPDSRDELPDDEIDTLLVDGY